ncbi:MAG TPA: hypothetical protein VGN33_09470 [Leifsonia sp.]|jgi:hypothetical protein|nr:hypothetical protein [Leifsonia sp.]
MTDGELMNESGPQDGGAGSGWGRQTLGRIVLAAGAVPVLSTVLWTRNGFNEWDVLPVSLVLITGGALLAVGVYLVRQGKSAPLTRYRANPDAELSEDNSNADVSERRPTATAVNLAETARDTSTTLEELALIAYEHEELRPLVAANPSAYPGLVNWLRELGDPLVDRALRTRDDAD